MNLPHRLDRTVVIQATPQIVFSFFTESDRWASWWGAGSTIEPKSGGRVYIRHANGIESSGEVVEVDPPTRIVFTYGFNSGNPIPPGSSRVTISLAPQGRGTRLDLLHEFADAGPRDEHVQGWRYQLSVFGNVVADLVNINAAEAADAWFGAWSETSRGHAQTTARDHRLPRRAIPRPLQPARRARRSRSLTSAPHNASCPVCTCDGGVMCGTARERSSSTGSPSGPTEASAAAARTSSCSARTA